MSSKRLRLDALLLTLAALPITFVESPEYEEQLREADRRIGARDPGDVHVLALALHLSLLVWTNDNDSKNLVVGVAHHG